MENRDFIMQNSLGQKVLQKIEKNYVSGQYFYNCPQQNINQQLIQPNVNSTNFAQPQKQFIQEAQVIQKYQNLIRSDQNLGTGSLPNSLRKQKPEFAQTNSLDEIFNFENQLKTQTKFSYFKQLQAIQEQNSQLGTQQFSNNNINQNINDNAQQNTQNSAEFNAFMLALANEQTLNIMVDNLHLDDSNNANNAQQQEHNSKEQKENN